MFWNSLPRHLRDPSHTDAVFGRLLKTFLFSEYCTQCIRGTCDDALYKLMFYLLTYLLTSIDLLNCTHIIYFTKSRLSTQYRLNFWYNGKQCGVEYFQKHLYINTKYRIVFCILNKKYTRQYWANLFKITISNQMLSNSSQHWQPTTGRPTDVRIVLAVDRRSTGKDRIYC